MSLRAVVVGAGAAGSRACQELVTDERVGEVHLVAAEADSPYYRPALSKQLLSGAWQLPQAQRTLVLDPSIVRHCVAAQALDIDGSAVELDDGERVPYDRLVIATGSVPRCLPGIEYGGRIHTIDTPVDVHRAREALSDSPSAVVIGAGLVGSEVASTLAATGAKVSIVDPSTTPLHRALGYFGDQLCQTWHTEAGIDVHLGRSVVAVRNAADAAIVDLDNGSAIAADLAMVCVGVRPASEWLSGSGLEREPDGGVRVDNCLMVSGHPEIAVAGDLAAWSDARVGRTMRVEHWTSAIEQGALAAKNVLDSDPQPYTGLPVFWTEQHGRLVHFVGYRGSRSAWVDAAEGELPRGGRVIAAVDESGTETGYLLIQAPQLLHRYKQQLANDFAAVT